MVVSVKGEDLREKYDEYLSTDTLRYGDISIHLLDDNGRNVLEFRKNGEEKDFLILEYEDYKEIKNIIDGCIDRVEHPRL